MTRSERKLLSDLSVALDHWWRQYAFCDRTEVRESQEAMMEAGGPLNYIAELQQRIRKALK